MKSLVSRAGGQAPSNGIWSHSHDFVQGAQKSPLALILASQMQRADSRLCGSPAFICQTRFPSVAEQAVHLYCQHLQRLAPGWH